MLKCDDADEAAILGAELMSLTAPHSATGDRKFHALRELEKPVMTKADTKARRDLRKATTRLSYVTTAVRSNRMASATHKITLTVPAPDVDDNDAL